MTDTKPSISTIMTVYNGEKYIKEAIRSILDQNYPNLDVWVIDDGSTDQTKEIATSFGETVNYIFQKNSGIAAGWNNGINSSGGDYLAFLDSDDIWTAGKLQRQMKFLQSHPQVMASFGYMEEFYSPGLPDETKKKYKCNEQAVPGYSAGTILISRKNFMEVGIFNQQWEKGIFSDWFLRAKEMNTSMHMDEKVMLKRRIHENNHGIKKRDKYVDYVRMLKASLDRKRSNPSN